MVGPTLIPIDDWQNPIITNREDEKKVALIPSILGLDFLNRYRLTIQNSSIILEK